AHVRRELRLFREVVEGRLPASQGLASLRAALKGVNERLWEVEDELRRCERSRDFGPRFVELARSVYRTNDERSSLQRQINDLSGSPLREEKDYPDYPR